MVIIKSICLIFWLKTNTEIFPVLLQILVPLFVTIGLGLEYTIAVFFASLFSQQAPISTENAYTPFHYTVSSSSIAVSKYQL